jgi:hypothetical protein
VGGAYRPSGRGGLLEVLVGLAIHAVGQVSKRGLIPRLPAPDKVLGDVQAWLIAEHPEVVRSMRCDRNASGETELVLDLHPAAEPVTIAVSDGGRVVASADTSAVGPGYHTFAGRLLERAGDTQGIDWASEAPAPGPAATSFAAQAAAARATAPLHDRPSVERAHLAWLGRLLVRAKEARQAGATGLHVGTRAGVMYRFDGALATPLGPRDDAWLEQASGDARVAIDLRPWWADATDARYLLHRALCLMWTEVRWRPPVGDAERAIMDEALRTLRKAFPLDPSLAYPWREWHELLVLRDVDDPMQRQVADRAARTPAERAPIGYRRDPVRISHAGWALEIPGSFAERRSEEEWWGGEGGRTITIAGIETGGPGGAMLPDAFLSRVANDLGDSVMTHRDGDLAGRARLGTDATSGIEVGVLEGFSAVPGRGAAIRITFDDADDWQWAIDRWKALRPA